MKFTLIMTAVFILTGCSISFSLGTSTQQVRSQWICKDAAWKTLEMANKFRVQRDLAKTDEERILLTRIVEGFNNQYQELVTKEECWGRP